MLSNFLLLTVLYCIVLHCSVQCTAHCIVRYEATAYSCRFRCRVLCRIMLCCIILNHVLSYHTMLEAGDPYHHMFYWIGGMAWHGL